MSQETKQSHDVKKSEAAGVIKVQKVKLRVEDCRVSTVTVFSDRAEITRVVSFCPDHTGNTELWVQGVTRSMDADSIRVKGTGPCEIQEVTFDIHMVTEEEEDEGLGNQERETKLVEVQNDIKRLDLEVSALRDREGILAQQKALLEGYVDGLLLPQDISMSTGGTETAGVTKSSVSLKAQVMMKSKVRHYKQQQENNYSNDDDDVGYAKSGYPSQTAVASNVSIVSKRIAPSIASMEGDVIEAAESLLGFFDSNDNQIDAELRQIGIDTERLQERLVPLRARSAKLQQAGAGQASRRESRDVTILLEVSASGVPIVLQMTYIVSCASWSPSYDIRISSEDNSMSLTYFGLVRQSTGEDWTNCEIKLSTAKPSQGGTPPDLPSKTISCSAYSSTNVAQKRVRGRAAGGRGGKGQLQQQQGQNEENRPTLAGADVSTAQVEGSSGGPATFVIPHQATIESDNRPHKVAVGIVNLQPTIMHYIAPAVDANAFLQAKTRNTSEYPFLPSEKVSVFFDGNFVTTTQMKHVSPGESFQNFLGRDPAVRVDYRPVRQTHRTTGMLTRTKATQYDHCTVVTNNKQVAVKLILADMLPRSSDERIRVDLTTPSTDELSSNARDFGGEEFELSCEKDQDAIAQLFDDDNPCLESIVLQNRMTHNLIWVKTLAPSQRVEVNFSYTVSCPQSETVEIN